MKKLLIVDDSATTRSMLEAVVQPLECHVIHAINGIDGIRKALRYHPDVITMDVEMPHLNGLLTTRVLSLLRLQIPIIFITSRKDIEDHIYQYPTVFDHCFKNDIRLRLMPLVAQALDHKPRQFTDLSYSLTQKEALDLLSLSDRKKILVVEDSKLILSSILKNLDHSGLFELYHAPDGREGLFKATLIRPDLILSDIEMPNIDGIMMAQMLYIIGQPFPLAFATAKSDEDTVKRVMKLEGVRGYLVKSEVLRDPRLFQRKIEEMMEISAEQKKVLQSSYKDVSVDKLKASGEKKGVFEVRYNPSKKKRLRSHRAATERNEASAESSPTPSPRTANKPSAEEQIKKQFYNELQQEADRMKREGW